MNDGRCENSLGCTGCNKGLASFHCCRERCCSLLALLTPGRHRQLGTAISKGHEDLCFALTGLLNGHEDITYQIYLV